jgi:hypothetical protein
LANWAFDELVFRQTAISANYHAYTVSANCRSANRRLANRRSANRRSAKRRSANRQDTFFLYINHHRFWMWPGQLIAGHFFFNMSLPPPPGVNFGP